MSMNLPDIGTRDYGDNPRKGIRLTVYSWGRLTPRRLSTTSSATNARPPATSRRGCLLRRRESQPIRPQKTTIPATAPSPITSTGASSTARWKDRSVIHTARTTTEVTATEAARRRMLTGAKAMLGRVVEANYVSGDDYVIEFQDHRFGFNADDFEERVTAAAVRLGLVADNDLDDDESADLVELVWRDWIDEPRSGLGRYLVRHWERISLVGGESLVYWLKKLVFRSAWLDHRVKEGILDVAWDEELADFAYRDPNGDRALLELAPVPSWHELQFRR
jgi:hypothetical protein